jgi:hypothetical protein
VLCWNGLEAAGGAAMGEMLALNMGLKHLDLSHCRLGPEACLLLGEGLKVSIKAVFWCFYWCRTCTIECIACAWLEPLHAGA